MSNLISRLESVALFGKRLDPQEGDRPLTDGDRSTVLNSLRLNLEAAKALRKAQVLAELAKWVFEQGVENGFDIDGGSAQDKLQTLGLLVLTPYDPDHHGEVDSEPGDPIFVLAPEWENALGDGGVFARKGVAGGPCA